MALQPNPSRRAAKRPSFDIEEHKSSGVWKIAHADFMTALMALFLVLWLVSATGSSMRRGIAQYYNPIKLSDSTLAPSGLQKQSDSLPGEQEIQEMRQNGGPIAQGDTKLASLEVGPDTISDWHRPVPQFSEAEIFVDPYGIIDKISGPVFEGEHGVARGGRDSQQAPGSLGLDGGLAQRDPFKPLLWQPRNWPIIAGAEIGRGSETAQVGAGMGSDIARPETGDTRLSTQSNTDIDSYLRILAPFPGSDNGQEALSNVPGEAPPTKQMAGIYGLFESYNEVFKPIDETDSAANEREVGKRPLEDTIAALDPSIDTTQSGLTSAEEDLAAEFETNEADGTTAEGTDDSTPLEKRKKASFISYIKDIILSDIADKQPEKEEVAAPIPEQYADAVRAELAAALGVAEESMIDGRSTISIDVTAEGVAINLNDDANFGMFAIGSSEPLPQTVGLMSTLAASLAARPGRLIIRGHTDGRPFRTAQSDNWRLSTARAHMARFMLIRSGVSEERFMRIEGHADQALANPDNPFDAVNRRIEILIKFDPVEG